MIVDTLIGCAILAGGAAVAVALVALGDRAFLLLALVVFILGGYYLGQAVTA